MSKPAPHELFAKLGLTSVLFKLAFRNVLHRKSCRLWPLAAIIFGVVNLILAGGFVQDTFIQLGEVIIHSQTGHLQIFKKDFVRRAHALPSLT